MAQDQRQAGALSQSLTDVVITPAMVEAGWNVLTLYDVPTSIPAIVLPEVFKAMIAAGPAAQA